MTAQWLNTNRSDRYLTRNITQRDLDKKIRGLQKRANVDLHFRTYALLGLFAIAGLVLVISVDRLSKNFVANNSFTISWLSNVLAMPLTLLVGIKWIESDRKAAARDARQQTQVMRIGLCTEIVHEIVDELVNGLHSANAIVEEGDRYEIHIADWQRFGDLQSVLDGLGKARTAMECWREGNNEERKGFFRINRIHLLTQNFGRLLESLAEVELNERLFMRLEDLRLKSELLVGGEEPMVTIGAVDWIDACLREVILSLELTLSVIIEQLPMEVDLSTRLRQIEDKESRDEAFTEMMGQDGAFAIMSDGYLSSYRPQSEWNLSVPID